MNKKDYLTPSNVKSVAIISLILLLIVGGYSVYSATVKDRAIRYENEISNAKTDISNFEKTRHDNLLGLAEVIKAYDEHEAQVLLDIANGRTEETKGNNASTILKAVAESYPELKSNTNYEKYGSELVIANEKVNNARLAYNNMITDYENYCTASFIKRHFLNGYNKKEFQRVDFGIEYQDMPTGLLD